MAPPPLLTNYRKSLQRTIRILPRQDDGNFLKPLETCCMLLDRRIEIFRHIDPLGSWIITTPAFDGREKMVIADKTPILEIQ